jgi:hypothetical protein
VDLAAPHYDAPVHAARAHLEQLFGYADSGYVSLWSSPSKAAWFYPVDDLDRVAFDAIELSKTGQVYCGSGVLGKEPPRGRGVANDVIGLPGFHMDVDIHSPGAHAADNLPPSIEAAVEMLHEFPIAPTMIIGSGHGLQVWWIFPETYYFGNRTDREYIETLLRRLQGTINLIASRSGWRLDSTFDLARVLRLAGTVNRKTDPRRVRILHLDEARRPNPVEFEKVTFDVHDIRASGVSGVAKAVESTIPEGQRNTVLTSLAGSLRYRGLDAYTIELALLTVNSRQCDPPLPECEVRSIANSIGRKPSSTRPTAKSFNNHRAFRKRTHTPPIPWTLKDFAMRSGGSQS